MRCAGKTRMTEAQQQQQHAFHDADKKYAIYADLEHSWIEVGMDELERLGIANRISQYSYCNGRLAYLEEDVDMFIFAQAKGWNDGDQIERHTSVITTTEGQSKIRKYDRFAILENQQQQSLLPDLRTTKQQEVDKKWDTRTITT